MFRAVGTARSAVGHLHKGERRSDVEQRPSGIEFSRTSGVPLAKPRVEHVARGRVRTADQLEHGGPYGLLEAVLDLLDKRTCCTCYLLAAQHRVRERSRSMQW